MNIDQVIEKANRAAVDTVEARDMILKLKDHIETREAYIVRMRKALGEIEDLNAETTELLTKAYEVKLWKPVKEKVENGDDHPLVTYHDGLAFFTEKLRPILLGFK